MHASLKGRALPSIAVIAVIAATALAVPVDSFARVDPVNDRGKPNFTDCLKVQNELDSSLSALSVASNALRQARSEGGFRGIFGGVKWQDVIDGIGTRVADLFKKWDILCSGFGNPFKTGPTCELEGREGDQVPVNYSRRPRPGDPGWPRISRA